MLHSWDKGRILPVLLAGYSRLCGDQFPTFGCRHPKVGAMWAGVAEMPKAEFFVVPVCPCERNRDSNDNGTVSKMGLVQTGPVSQTFLSQMACPAVSQRALPGNVCDYRQSVIPYAY